MMRATGLQSRPSLIIRVALILCSESHLRDDNDLISLEYSIAGAMEPLRRSYTYPISTGAKI
jgi:hypothetical protein